MNLPLSPVAPWDRAENRATTAGNLPVHSVSSEHSFSMAGWHVWCGSVAENGDGTFSLFFSCWPLACGHDGWVTHSEIWRAEGPTPWGPFKDPQVVFARDETPAWDAHNFHNVTVKNFDDRSFMYYTGNRGDGEWWTHRNAQRIGVAVAASPRGPWTRRDTPLIDTDPEAWDSLCVANPSVTRGPDGHLIMIYKGVTSGDLPYGSRVLHGMAIAPEPAGPFTKIDAPLFEVPGARFPFEDPHIWFSGGRYFCLMKDMVGLAGSCPRATLLFESEDGIHWPTDTYRLIATPHLHMPDGKIVKVDKLERPAYFAHETVPSLSFAVKPEGEEASFLVFSPGPLSNRFVQPS